MPYNNTLTSETMKVFDINYSGETAKVSASSAEEAKEFYLKETGMDETEIDSVKEVPYQMWEDFTILYCDEIGKSEVTLKLRMQGVTTNELLCQTAY
jgi:hypothetical protein